MCCNNRNCISNGLVILFGVLFGVLVALVWFFGFAIFTRAMVPYALAFAIILFITTAIFRAICGNYRSECHQEFHLTPTCCSLSKYSPLILISAAISIVASLVFLATNFTFTGNAILAFIDAISFGTMLFGFLGMILCISFRRE